MNKKYAIVSIVLIALMALALIPTATKAFISPSGADDQKFQEYGPKATQLLIKIYSDYTSEFVGFQGQQVDIMDWPLDPADYNTIRAGDPANLTYTEAFTSQFSLFEWDIYDAVMPTNLTAFRIGLSWMINNDFFINYYSGLQGAATKADSPIASCTGYYNPLVTNLYETGHARTTLTPYPDDDTDILNAYNSFVAALGAPVPDDGSANAQTGAVDGNMMFTWASPFTTPSVVDGIPAIHNGHLLVFARSSSPARTKQGQYMQTLLEHSLPNWLNAHGYPAAHIYVDLYVASRTVCFDQAMSAAGPNQYRYHVYTGGWSLGRDPDFLQYYTSAYAPQAHGMAPDAHNYGAYQDIQYDAIVQNLLNTANPGGNPLTPGTATYYAYQAQAELMGSGWSPTTGDALIPSWYTTGYIACLTSLHNVVNQVGFGINSWQTMLNAYNPGGTIKYGFQSDWSSGNPITAPWVWDWDVLNEIYDGLISVNPYNMGQDRPYIADNWTYSTWTTAGTPWVAGGTYAAITFNLREDVYWQDVPLKDRSAYTWNNSHVDDGPFVGYPLTPLDVAFSMITARDLDTFDTTQNGILVDPYSGLGVDHVAMSPAYAVDWPYTSKIPEWFNQTAIVNDYGAKYPDGSPLTWQYNSVVFDPTLNSEQITIYLTSPSRWIGLHHVAGLPVLPYHVWRNLQLDTWDNSFGHSQLGMGWIDASPSGADITYGTGPYILTDHTAGVSFTLVPYTVGQTYEGLSSSHGYFWNSPIRTQDTSAGPGPASSPAGDTEAVYWKQGTNTVWYSPGVIVNRDPTNSYTFTVQAFLDYETYYSGAWHLGPGTTSLGIQTLTLAGGATVQPWFNTGPLTFPVGTTYIVVWESYTITITAGPAGTVGRISQGGDHGYANKKLLSDNDYKYGLYTGRQFEMFNVAHSAAKADVSGAIAANSKEPYFGSDYKVAAADLTTLATNWGKAVPWTGLIDPTDGLHRADFVGAGKVGAADLTALAQGWGSRGAWTDTPPADPASGYIP